MPITNTLQLANVIEKNKVSTASAWIALFEIEIAQNGSIVRLANNNEDIVWDGQTWIGFPVQIPMVGEDGEELPNAEVRVCNIDDQVGDLLRPLKGAGGSLITIRVINTDHLDAPESIKLVYEIQDVHIDEWVTIELGGAVDFNQQVPDSTNDPHFCRYREFKGLECGYAGAATECNRTLSFCRSIGNSVRWGGEKGLDV